MLTCCIMSYQYGHLVAHSIESVLSQTKRPDKIIVIDDGVGDCGIAKKYPVTFIERPKNFGIVENFNEALYNKAEGRVLFLGADNWLRPDAIEVMSEIDADIVSCDLNLFGEKVDEWREGQDTQFINGHWVWHLPSQPHGSALYNVEKAIEAGGYEASGGTNSEEDSMLFQKMIKNGASFAHTPEPLIYYRRHRANFQ